MLSNIGIKCVIFWKKAVKITPALSKKNKIRLFFTSNSAIFFGKGEKYYLALVQGTLAQGRNQDFAKGGGA